MLMRDIGQERRLTFFARVAMPSIHVEVLNVEVVCRDWSELEERLLERYGFDDSLRMSKREVMEWLKLLGKGRNKIVLLQEFERRLARFSALDRTVFDTSKVMLFIKAVDMRDREKLSSCRRMKGSQPIGPW